MRISTIVAVLLIAPTAASACAFQVGRATALSHDARVDMIRRGHYAPTAGAPS